MAFDRRTRRGPFHVARGNAYAQLELEGQVFARKGICLAQHDQNVANDTGAAVRSDINNALAALFTLSSGAAAPATTIAYMLWADTTSNLLKQRNAANTGWLVRGSLAETFVLARSLNTIVGVGDFGRTLNCTGTFTQTLTAAATLGDGFLFYIRNNGTGVITIDPNGAETIDGAATITLAPGEGCAVLCNGSAFITIGRAHASLQWTFKNRLINPDGVVYQRAVAATADDVYFADRWYMLTQSGTVTPSVLSDPEDGFPKGVRITQSQAVAQRFGFAQIIEGKNCKDLRGQSGVLVPRVRISASQAIRYAILAWTGTEDVVTSDVVNDWTSVDYTDGAAKFFLDANITPLVVGAQTPIAATWTSLAAITAALGSTFNNLIVVVWTEGTAAQNVTLDFDYVQLERGNVPTEFERRASRDELALCQRYYERSVAVWTVPGDSGGSSSHAIVTYKATKRANPTVSTALAGGAALTGVANGDEDKFRESTAGGASDFTWTASAEL